MSNTDHPAIQCQLELRYDGTVSIVAKSGCTDLDVYELLNCYHMPSNHRPSRLIRTAQRFDRLGQEQHNQRHPGGEQLQINRSSASRVTLPLVGRTAAERGGA